MRHSLIAIVDDDEAIRLSTCSLLKRAGFEVRMFKSGNDFLNNDQSEPVSCILLDLQMPGMDGLAVLRALRGRDDSTPVLVITGHGDVTMAVEAMKLGALDFMEKPYAPETLLATITQALTAGTAVDEAQALRDNARALVETLSARQRQVLHGILQGLQNKIIAFQLNLSVRTIEAYRAQLMVKLGVRGTADAVRVALAAGMGMAGSVILSVYLLLALTGREIPSARLPGTDLEPLGHLAMV